MGSERARSERLSGRRTLQLTEPHLLHDDERPDMPALVRLFLGILNVSDFLELTNRRGQPTFQ